MGSTNCGSKPLRRVCIRRDCFNGSLSGVINESQNEIKNHDLECQGVE